MADEPTSRKLQEKQQRRAAEEERRRIQQRAGRKRNLITALIALAVVAIVVVAVFWERGSDGGSGGNVGVGPKAAGCTAIEEHEEEGAEHVDVEPQYATNPPTSGNHLATPSNPGFFEDPVRPGALVHNMEHGQIIFWYDPNAPDDVIEQIEQVVDQEFAATLAVPWDDIDGSFNFVMTAWTASQSCVKVSQEVVDDFRERFQGRGPEQIPGIDPV